MLRPSSIALDTAAHRKAIRHRETGLLCRNSSEVRLAIAELVDSAELRQRIGFAARQEAQRQLAANPAGGAPPPAEPAAPTVWIVRPGDHLTQNRTFAGYKVTDTAFAGPTMFADGDTVHRNQHGALIAKEIAQWRDLGRSANIMLD